MKKLLIRLARLALFFAGIYVLVYLGNTFLVQLDTVAYMTMKDMRERDDIELALVGSSIVQRHLNPALITEETGLQAFDVTMTTLSPAGAIPLTKELYRHNSPDYTVLVVESYTFDTVKEDIQTQMKLMPLLTSPVDRARYVADVAGMDGRYMDRILLFRSFGFESADDVIKALRLRLDTERYFAGVTESWKGEMAYSDGFLRHNKMESIERELRETFIRQETGYYYEIFDYTKEKLLEYKALVEANGSELIVVALPALTIHALAEPGVLPYLDSAAAFFRENDIPFYNLMYAREELLPLLDAHYYDLYHMVGDGADLLSAAFSRVINGHIAGEDMSGWFWHNRWQYVDSIDFITNVWFTREDGEDGTVTLTADCNRGTHVTAEYRYVLRGEDGSETLLRDYDTEPVFTADAQALAGGTLRIYGRVQGESDALWYEIPE